MSSLPTDAILTQRARKPLARHITYLVLLCALSSVIGWAFWVSILGHALGQDFMVFYTAARAFFVGDLPFIYDGQWMTDYVNAHFADWLSFPLNFHPFLYPPYFLLLLMPFGLLPFGISYALFLSLSFGGLIATTWSYVERVERKLLLLIILLVFPQTPFTLLTGQNSFLTASLLIGGFALLERNALLAGILLGIASYKPQFWLMVPFALVAARQWQAIVSAAATTAVIAVVSLALFGWDIWRDWLIVMIRPSDAYEAWLVAGRLNGQSVYACLASLGASAIIANIAQAIAATIAAAAVFWCFRHGGTRDLKVAVILATTLLAAPHVSSQDGIMLAIAATFLFFRALDEGFRRGDILLIASIWLVELCDPPVIFKLGALTPLAIGWFIVAIILRIQASASRPSDRRIA